MKGKAIAITLMALCTALAVCWLWTFWTPRCNEECAAHTVVGIYSLLLAAVAATLALAVMVAAGRLSVRQGALSYLVATVAVALAVGALVLTR